MSERSDIIPIFVLGGARNGTTWLGNVLGLHPEIATVQHELHHGSHESNIFRQERYYGDLTDPDAYIRFVELYGTEDYFTLAGGSRQRLYEQRFATFYHAFFDLMDRYARAEGKVYWSTKLDPLFTIDPAGYATLLGILRERYKNVKWVGIQREVVQCMNSYVFMEGSRKESRGRAINRLPVLALGTARYAAQYDFLKAVARDENAFWMEFDELKNQRAATSQRLDQYLGLSDSLSIDVAPKYKKNTSFKGDTARQTLSGTEKKTVLWLSWVFDRVPALARMTYRFYENRIKGIQDPTYRKLLKYRYFPEDFTEELSTVGASDIIEILQNSRDTPRT